MTPQILETRNSQPAKHILQRRHHRVNTMSTNDALHRMSRFKQFIVKPYSPHRLSPVEQCTCRAVYMSSVKSDGCNALFPWALSHSRSAGWRLYIHTFIHTWLSVVKHCESSAGSFITLSQVRQKAGLKFLEDDFVQRHLTGRHKFAIRWCCLRLIFFYVICEFSMVSGRYG